MQSQALQEDRLHCGHNNSCWEIVYLRAKDSAPQLPDPHLLIMLILYMITDQSCLHLRMFMTRGLGFMRTKEVKCVVSHVYMAERRALARSTAKSGSTSLARGVPVDPILAKLRSLGGLSLFKCSAAAFFPTALTSGAGSPCKNTGCLLTSKQLQRL